MIRGAPIRGICFLFLGIMAFAGPAWSQSYLTRSYSLEEGLPQSQVSSMLQDHAGYLWIGTQGGLSRFDGMSFTNYSLEQGLLSTNLTSLAEDAQGRIWLGTPRGLNVFDGHDFDAYGVEEGLPHPYIFSLLNRPDGHMWVGTKAGLVTYNGSQFQPVVLPDSLPHPYITALANGLDGSVWIGTGRGICQWRPQAPLTCFEDEEGITQNAIFDVMIDQEGFTWMGHAQGASCLGPAGWVHLGPEQGLPTGGVYALLNDNDGGIWFGARRGIARWNANRDSISTWHQGWIVRELIKDQEGNVWVGSSGKGIIQFRKSAFSHVNPILDFPEDTYLSAYQDRAGRHWFGSLSYGLFRMDGHGITQFGPADVPGLNHVRTFAEDQQDRLWIGTSLGAFRYDGASFEPFPLNRGGTPPYVYSVVPAQDGRVWFGTASGPIVLQQDTLATPSLGPAYSPASVHTLREEEDGRMWMGGANGLFWVDEDRATRVESIGQRPVTSISVDADGYYWVGTLGHGVLRYDHESRTVIDSFQVAHGLNSGTVFFTRFDVEGQLWIGTSGGVNRVDMNQYHLSGQKNIRAYGIEDGIVGVETNMNAALVDTSGRLWFGTLTALMQYDKTSRPFNNTPPPTYLTGIRLFRNTTDWSSIDQKTGLAPSFQDGTRLSHNKNHLTFDFQAVSFTTPEHVRYQYRMAGLEAEWSPPTSARFATYPNLPPGSYTFEVKARNSHGVESALPASVHFSIRAPIWQQTWFILLLIGIGLLGIWATIRLRTRALEHRRKHLESLVAERTQSLQHANEELTVAREEALVAAKSKHAFMAVMTHELRTPMNGILGMSELMATTELDEEQTEYTEIILDCSTSLLDLIENLLTFSDLAAGQRISNPEPFSLPDLIAESMQHVAEEAQAKQLETRTFMAPDVPRNILADREHLRQILQHLLSNAVKFTQEGLVLLEVQHPEATGNRLRFDVHDTGIGMQEEQIVQIFEPFAQADMSETRAFGGSGLGLALVRQLTELLNSRLHVESTPGVGSTFSVEYTFEPGERSSQAEQTTRQVFLQVTAARERRRLELLCRSLGLLPIPEPPSMAPVDLIITDQPTGTQALTHPNTHLIALDVMLNEPSTNTENVVEKTICQLFSIRRNSTEPGPEVGSLAQSHQEIPR